MKRLCIGSYLKILALCKSAVGKSQKNISGTVMLSVGVETYDIRTDDGKTHDLLKCKATLPPDVVDAASKIDTQADKSALTDYFRTNVLPQVDSNKKSDVVLALKDIIANDTEIKPDTVVDKVAGLTKADIASTDTFVFVDFLAGVFLYAVTVVINTEGKVSASTINKDYLSQFSGRDVDVKFIDRLTETLNFDDNEPYSTDANCEFADGVRVESDFTPNLQQNIYNQTIDVKGNGNVVNGFVFNLNNRG